MRAGSLLCARQVPCVGVISANSKSKCALQDFEDWDGNDCLEQLSMELRPMWTAASAAAELTQQRLSETARLPGFAELSVQAHSMARGSLSVALLLKTAEATILDNVARAEWLAQLHSQLPETRGEARTAVLSLHHELELAAVNPLAMDPLAHANVRARDVRAAHARCGYNAVLLEPLLASLGADAVRVHETVTLWCTSDAILICFDC
eukprot:SAG11_NODE_3959_length_2132_cov_1.651254_2_plen_208_part_00